MPDEQGNMSAATAASTGREAAGAADASDPFVEHPEYFVGGAFAAGIVAAQVLKLFGRHE